jgi:hypothetical protein
VASTPDQMQRDGLPGRLIGSSATRAAKRCGPSSRGRIAAESRGYQVIFPMPAISPAPTVGEVSPPSDARSSPGYVLGGDRRLDRLQEHVGRGSRLASGGGGPVAEGEETYLLAPSKWWLPRQPHWRMNPERLPPSAAWLEPALPRRNPQLRSTGRDHIQDWPPAKTVAGRAGRHRELLLPTPSAVEPGTSRPSPSCCSWPGSRAGAFR